MNQAAVRYSVVLWAKHCLIEHRLGLRFHRKWVSEPLTNQLPIINQALFFFPKGWGRSAEGNLRTIKWF